MVDLPASRERRMTQDSSNDRLFTQASYVALVAFFSPAFLLEIIAIGIFAFPVVLPLLVVPPLSVVFRSRIMANRHLRSLVLALNILVIVVSAVLTIAAINNWRETGEWFRMRM
jgi:O-antigen/teichoic acid export membrane protein